MEDLTEIPEKMTRAEFEDLYNRAVSSVPGRSTTILLSVKEASVRLRLGKTTVYALAREREISTVRIGAKILFPAAEIEAYIKRRTVPAKRQFTATKAWTRRGIK
jgi:excisionase family DNA binding protein